MNPFTLRNAFTLATAEFRLLNYMDRKEREKEEQEQAKREEEMKAAQAESIAQERARAAEGIVKKPEPEEEPVFGKRNKYV